MDDEFKLCWKNFQDNIASGFQNLYDRGDLVDVTLACDGKLLHAHKIVLAICSPYFQEIFITNPCKHPIIILKDVHFNIMCELLEFMYQGVVNVKHTELQSFMKIGQLLQIKGLATNPPTSSASAGLDEKGSSDIKNSAEFLSNADADSMNSSSNTLKDGKSYDSATKITTNSQNTSVKGSVTSPASSPSSPKNSISQESMVQNNFPTGLKRLSELNSDAASNYSKKPFRRSASHLDPNSDQNDGHNSDGVDNVNPEDFFLSIPHISMVESRYDLNSVKREGDPNSNSSMANSMRSSFGSSLGFEYNLYKNNGGLTTNSSSEFPNELHVPNDYSKNFGNHMDIPPIAPGEHWFQGKLEFMLSQRGKPLLVHDGHTFGIQYVRKDKKYWQCNLSRKFNCKARVTTTDTGEIIVTNNEHCHTEIRQHLRKDYQRNKVMMNALINLSSKRFAENLRRESENSIHNLSVLVNNPPMVNNPPINLKSSKPDESERSSIDFSGSESTPDIIKAMIPPDDNELPLDCGIRSVASDDKHEPIDVNNAWKLKNEAV